MPKIERILARLDIASRPDMMDLPGLGLHPLQGHLKGFWSVSVSGNWRIIFRFSEENAVDVDLVDYHYGEENREMPMKEPPHTGLAVRFDCLEPLGLSITDGAKVLGVTRQALNNLVNGKAGISPEMAIRLDKAFGGTAEAWLALQTAYDLAQVRKHESRIRVKRYEAKAS